MGGSSRVVAARWRGSLVVTSAFVLLFGASCVAPKTSFDLAEDPELYAGTGYEARVAADRIAFVMPVVDKRGSQPEEASLGPYPIHWFGEGYWKRSLPTMLDELLRRELDESGVVGGLDEAPPPATDALLIRAELIRGRAGIEELVEGRRAVAEVAMQVQVFGPADGSGQRPKWVERLFERSTGTGLSMQPPPLPGVYAGVVQALIGEVLEFLDESNVARSGVPLMLDEPDSPAGGAADAGGR